jgi:glutamine synthetase type III
VTADPNISVVVEHDYRITADRRGYTIWKNAVPVVHVEDEGGCDVRTNEQRAALALENLRGQ